MDLSGNVRNEEVVKKIITYNNENGEVQIIVPKRESKNNSYTTDILIRLSPSEVQNLYTFLKSFLEPGE